MNLLSLSTKNIFLFDGVGALISLFVTGLILPQMSDILGIPAPTLYLLAIFPFVYSIFSLGCYYFVNEIQSWMLIAIVLANLFYCVLSSAIVLRLPTLQTLGAMVILGEIFVVAFVVYIELKTLRKYFH